LHLASCWHEGWWNGQALLLCCAQNDRLLKPALENVIKLWKDPKMPTMELHFMKLTKADKEFLKGKFLALSFVNYFQISLYTHCWSSLRIWQGAKNW
jgi:hypothetical protein